MIVSNEVVQRIEAGWKMSKTPMSVQFFLIFRTPNLDKGCPGKTCVDAAWNNAKNTEPIIIIIVIIIIITSIQVQVNIDIEKMILHLHHNIYIFEHLKVREMFVNTVKMEIMELNDWLLSVSLSVKDCAH